jgi:hypothetical protein
MEGDGFGGFFGLSLRSEDAECIIFFLGETLLLNPLFDCALFPSTFLFTGVLVKNVLQVADEDKSLPITSNFFLIFSTLLLDSGGDTYDIVTCM